MKDLKKIIVDELVSELENSPFLIVCAYERTTVKQFQELRKRLRPLGASAQVIKNSYVKLALAEKDLPALSDHLTGQTLHVTGGSDVAGVAKVLKSFAKEFQRPEIRGGVLDGAELTKAEIEALADLPSREVLLATILGLINAPASQLVRTINEPGSALARVIKAFAEKDAA